MVLLFTDSDYDPTPAEVRVHVGATGFTLNVNTLVDSVIEANEDFTVTAALPHTRGACGTRITIVDDSKLLINKHLRFNNAVIRRYLTCSIYFM